MLSLLKKQNQSQSSSKTHSKGKLRKHFKKTAPQESILKVYERFIKADNKKNERKSLLKTIEMCYNNLANQIQLTEMLHLPFIPGPVSLHAFPTVLLEQNQVIGHRGEGEEEGEQTQLEFLFNYLKNVRQYYYCWVIYFNEDLKILNVKLLKREEMQDNEDLFNPILNLIGIFINRAKERPSKISHQGNRNYVQQYYGRDLQRQAADANHHNKSISTINSSTGTTWKAMAKMEKIKEDREEQESEYNYNGEGKQKMESRLIKVRSKESKKYSLSKWNQQFKTIKKQNKSFSIKQLKQKSKSQILLNRSKSNNFKQIILQPIKNDEPSSQKFKVLHPKTKLKKESKTNKIASIYFKKPPIAQ